MEVLQLYTWQSYILPNKTLMHPLKPPSFLLLLHTDNNTLRVICFSEDVWRCKYLKSNLANRQRWMLHPGLLEETFLRLSVLFLLQHPSTPRTPDTQLLPMLQFLFPMHPPLYLSCGSEGTCSSCFLALGGSRAYGTGLAGYESVCWWWGGGSVEEDDDNARGFCPNTPTACLESFVGSRPKIRSNKTPHRDSVCFVFFFQQ